MGPVFIQLYQIKNNMNFYIQNECPFTVMYYTFCTASFELKDIDN